MSRSPNAAREWSILAGPRRRASRSERRDNPHDPADRTMASPEVRALHRAVDYALRLRAAVENGEARDLDKEQAALTNLVLDTPGGQPGGESRGARYALVCWIDELFTCHSRWAAEWNEQKLESALYGGNDRAWEFWRQAKLADAEPTDDTLAAYYLAVALGFRGDLRDQPQRLEAWVEKTRTRVARGATPPGSSAGEIRGPKPAARLYGAGRVRRFVAVATAAAACLAPLATYALVQHLRG